MKVTETASSKFLRETFMSALLQDVAAAQKRLDGDDNQSHRRELIRTLFAAIEGMAWLYREHVLEIAKSTGSLSADENGAYAEVAYTVTEQGKIVTQARFIPIPAMLRLTTRLAARLNPALEARFGEQGWEQFKQALKIRNRVTHPKAARDLAVDDNGLATCHAGFRWLFELSLSALEAANEALRKYNAEARAVLDALCCGEPEAVALHEAILREDGT